ncbi:PREDICTED: uncharacterized protein LOC108377418, partial [Rhagoletis zephyria]|uniref:uncharacterized protein LOC108377418 n=1 Tax=Rhagoletis zephyria TaxID=28612 RepID=UPI00081184A4
MYTSLYAVVNAKICCRNSSSSSNWLLNELLLIMKQQHKMGVKHPHVIFEARTKANKGCANSGNLDSWRISRRTKHLSAGVIDEIHPNGAGRYKRDVREATKYIETAIIVDKAMFEKRNGSTRAEVIHDAIQVANIADLYFRTLNTRVSVVYIETWGKNQAVIDGSKDISKAISNFNDYTSRNLFQIERDTTQLLT